MKVVRRILIVAAAVLAPLTMVATPAQAAGPRHVMWTDDAGWPGGKVVFRPIGDKVRVCDTASDGWGVKVIVYNKSEGYSPFAVWEGGYGDCINVSWNLREYDCFRFTIYLGRDGEITGLDRAYWRNDNHARVTC